MYVEIETRVLVNGAQMVMNRYQASSNYGFVSIKSYGNNIHIATNDFVMVFEATDIECETDKDIDVFGNTSHIIRGRLVLSRYGNMKTYVNITIMYHGTERDNVNVECD